MRPQVIEGVSLMPMIDDLERLGDKRYSLGKSIRWLENLPVRTVAQERELAALRRQRRQVTREMTAVREQVQLTLWGADHV